MKELVLYFGCWDQPGHYLHHPGGYKLYDAARSALKCPFDNALDGTFAPPFVNEREDVTALSVVHNWTILGMWDRSVDNRPNSNAAFLAPGVRTEAEMWALAREQYPQIVSRLKAAQAAETSRA